MNVIDFNTSKRRNWFYFNVGASPENSRNQDLELYSILPPGELFKLFDHVNYKLQSYSNYQIYELFRSK